MKTTKDLPDLDTLDPSAIAQLAEAAKAEEAAIERIYAALTEATLDDKLGIAALVIMRVRGCLCPPAKSAKAEVLLSHISDESLISLAIAILEGVQSKAQEDAIVPPDCEFDS